MKTCSKCKAPRSEADFYLYGASGKSYAACKKCCIARRKVYCSENKDKLAAKDKIYYAKNREELLAQKKVYRAENKDKTAARNKRYRSENREELRAKKKIYYVENKDKIAAKDKLYNVENREKRAGWRRVYKYGVAPDTFKSMLIEQGGVCAICKGAGSKRGLFVDHDHDSKRFRGILCQACNTAIGYLRDSSAIAQLATNYLKQNGK